MKIQRPNPAESRLSAMDSQMDNEYQGWYFLPCFWPYKGCPIYVGHLLKPFVSLVGEPKFNKPA